MPRATVLNNVQVGVEAVKGTAIAASNRFLVTNIDLQPVPQIKQHRPKGSKFNTARQRGKEWTQAAVDGPICYGELPYLLRTLLVSGAGLTYKPAPFVAGSHDTLTVEVGSTTRCERIAYGFMSDLRFVFSKEEASLSGRMIGREIEEGVVITAGAANVDNTCVNPDIVEVYLGASVAGLAKVADITRAEIGLTGRWSPFFSLDSAEDSFRETTEAAPDMTAQFIIPHEATAAGYMTDLRATTQRFFRVLASELIGAITYSVQITAPFTFLDNPRGDQDDAYCSTFNLGLDYDSAFAGAMEIVVTNT